MDAAPERGGDRAIQGYRHRTFNRALRKMWKGPSMTTDPKSGTPRTDEFAFEYLKGPAQSARVKRDHEWIAFARTLERELSRCRKELERLQGDSIELRRSVVQAKAERDDAEERLASHAEREGVEPWKGCFRVECFRQKRCIEPEYCLNVAPQPPAREIGDSVGHERSPVVATPAPSAASGLADELEQIVNEPGNLARMGIKAPKVVWFKDDSKWNQIIAALRSHQAPVGEGK
jgi:hypothetical protein